MMQPLMKTNVGPPIFFFFLLYKNWNSNKNFFFLNCFLYIYLKQKTTKLKRNEKHTNAPNVIQKKKKTKKQAKYKNMHQKKKKKNPLNSTFLFFKI